MLFYVPGPVATKPYRVQDLDRQTMMKKQTGLTIIKLMVLLLIAGIVGSLLISALIRHRCLADPDAQMCAAKSAAIKNTSIHALLRQ